MSFVNESIPEQRSWKGDAFPFVLRWQISDTGGSSSGECSGITHWLKTNTDYIDEQLRRHKAILFRCGNYIATHNEFHAVCVALNYSEIAYVGGAAVRTQLTSRVFTANESPASENIPFHHEMAQTPDPPTHLLFFCEDAPTSGGATPILVSPEVYERLSVLQPEFMNSLERCGVKYVRIMPECDDSTSAIGRGWRSTFQCTDRGSAEDALRSLGSSWEWLTDGSLRTVTATVPAIRTDDQPASACRSGEKTFFNSVVAAYTGWNDSRNRGESAVVFGGGVGAEAASSEEGRCLPASAIEDAVRVMQEVCVAFPWQRGDVLLLDNRTVMHSRQSFEGPRRILASLARDPLR